MIQLPLSFLTRPIAHRGLHDVSNGRPENSSAAIAAANTPEPVAEEVVAEEAPVEEAETEEVVAEAPAEDVVAETEAPTEEAPKTEEN